MMRYLTWSDMKWFLKPVGIALALGLMLALFGVATGNADSISPTASNEGCINAYSYDNYATVHNAATGDNAQTAFIEVGQNYIFSDPDQIWFIRRAFATFAIPEMSAITSVVLHLNGQFDASTTDFEIYVVSSTYSNPLVIGDYDLVGTTSWNNAWNSSSYSADDNALTFNATGLAAVLAAEGTTLRIGLRSKRDVDSTAPTGNEYIDFDLNPTLTITYTPLGWTGTIGRTTNPTAVGRSDKANITSIGR